MKKLIFALVGLLLVACSPTFPTPVPSPTATPFEYALLLSPSAPTPKVIGLYFGSDCLGDGQPDETHAGRGNSGGEYNYCRPEATPEALVLIERDERGPRPTQATSTVAPTESTPTPVTPTATTPEAPTATPEPPVMAGNPGNTKDVGQAGENPNGRNTMPLDNAGGNGNGQHGNQR